MGCNQSTEKKSEETQTSTRDGGRRDSFFEHRDLEISVKGTSEGEGEIPVAAEEPHRSKVTHICLTGGPCAGKSSALADLQTRFQQQSGIKVFCVPEAATMMVCGGMDWADISDETRTEYQLALLRAQLALEDTFLSIAKAYGKPAVVISDRGTMDGRAFCSQEAFDEVLRRGNFELEQLRDRYDAVVHMVSAAKGAIEHYNMDNLARQEGPEGAVIADDNLRKCYIGHSNIKIFDNSTHFQGKLDRVFDSVGETCGTKHVAHHRTRRYLTTVPRPDDVSVPFVNVIVTLTILANSNPDLVRSVMSRRQGGNCVYFYQVIRYVESQSNKDTPTPPSLSGSPDGSPVLSDSGAGGRSFSVHPGYGAAGEPSAHNLRQIKEEHRINSREYLSLLEQRDKTRVDIVKDNISFMFEDTYYEIGVFASPKVYSGVAIMYVNCQEDAEMPPFVLEYEDVTDKVEYSSYNMSATSESTSPGVSPMMSLSPPKSAPQTRRSTLKGDDKQYRSSIDQQDDSVANSSSGSGSPSRKNSLSKKEKNGGVEAAKGTNGGGQPHEDINGVSDGPSPAAESNGTTNVEEGGRI